MVSSDRISGFPLEEYDQRITRARLLMADAGLDALLVTENNNYYYFTGHNIKPHVQRPYFFILPMEQEPILITKILPFEETDVYKTAFPSWVSDRRTYIDVPFSTDPEKDWGVKEALKDLGLEAGRIGAELGEDTRLEMPVSDFLRLTRSLPKAKFVDASRIFWKLRVCKSRAEIDFIKKACDVTALAWQKVWENLEEGVSRDEIARLTMKYFLEEGADPADPGAVYISPPHGSGPKGTYVKGDMVRLDGGAKYMRYRSDYSRSAIFGKPSEKQKKFYEAAVNIVWKCIDAVKPHVKVSEIWRTANEEYKKLGLEPQPPERRVGHGIGLQSEPPSLNGIDTHKLEVGMVITPEPEKLDVPDVQPYRFHYEETIVVTNDGCEVLSDMLGTELRVI